MPDMAPKGVIGETAFGNKAMDVRVPLEGAAEGMEYTDEAGDKVFGFIKFMEQKKDNASDSLKEAVKEGTVLEEKMSEPGINGKDTMAVAAGKQFEGHTGGAFLGVFDAAGGAEAGVAAERDEFHAVTIGAGIHSAALGMLAAKKHPVHVSDNNGAWM